MGMLRPGASHAFGCCDHCARNKKKENKPARRERRLARARETQAWKKEVAR